LRLFAVNCKFEFIFKGIGPAYYVIFFQQEKKKKGNKRQEKMLGPQHDGRHGASARINRIAHRVRHQLRPDKVGRFGSHGL
jgi:hypothetical protein